MVSAPHQKAGYDRLWLTDALSRRDNRDGLQWHRTQDVGHLDAEGRLWIEGRLQHVVTTPAGPVAPGGPEARIERRPERQVRDGFPRRRGSAEPGAQEELRATLRR